MSLKIIVDKPADGGNTWKCEFCKYANISGGDGFDQVSCQAGVKVGNRRVTRCNRYEDKRVNSRIHQLPMSSVQPALFLETNDEGKYEWQSWQKWRTEN